MHTSRSPIFLEFDVHGCIFHLEQVVMGQWFRQLNRKIKHNKIFENKNNFYISLIMIKHLGCL